MPEPLKINAIFSFGQSALRPSVRVWVGPVEIPGLLRSDIEETADQVTLKLEFMVMRSRYDGLYVAGDIHEHPGPFASDETLEAMARAHDEEESAQKGEPSLWAIQDRGDWQGDDGDWAEFRSERLTAMRCALKAVGLA